MNRPVVVNTRPREQAADLSRLLRAAGFEPLEVPAIEVVPSFNAEERASILERLRVGAYTWLVLPSQNAARFFPEALPNQRLLCGRATAAAVGLAPATTLDPFSASAALAWLAPQLRAGDRVLMPRAADGRDELELGLRALGVVVDAPVCYRTVPAPPSSLLYLSDRLRAGAIAAVTFCSPSAVKALAVDLKSTRIICLGRITANAATERALRVDAISETTSMPALVDGVKKALAGVPA
jgi:uroporphyrinogen-III synthase